MDLSFFGLRLSEAKRCKVSGLKKLRDLGFRVWGHRGFRVRV